MPWKNGQSGNPHGRPKGTKGVGWRKVEDLRAYAQEMTKAAMDKAYALMMSDSTPPNVQLSAAMFIIERGWGKAHETTDINVDARFRNMSDEELVAYIMGESEEILELEAEDVSDAGADDDEP